MANGSSIASGPAPADCSFVLLMARAFYGTRDVLRRWASAGLYNEYHQIRRRRTRPSGPGRTNLLGTIGTTARPTLGGFSCLPIIGTDPLVMVIRHSIRLAARSFGGAGLNSGSARWRTQERTEAGGPSGAMGCDSITASGRANVLPRDQGLVPALEEIIQMRQRPQFVILSLASL